MEAMIDVIHLRKRFGIHNAVDDISFSVKQGEVLGFLGPNGAGKSTTMKMITGFLAPTEGTARVCGDDILQDPVKVKAAIGYLPEGAPAYGEMTPKSYLQFIAEIRGFRGTELNQRVNNAIEKVNLQGVIHQPIETLSKGFKRRVGLAQAILHDPPVLIMDEPTDGLDPNQKHEVRELIRAMAQNKAIVVSTHILEEVSAVCTRAIIIAQGKLLFDGTPDELAALSTLHNAVSVTLRGADANGIKSQLRSLPDVAKVNEISSENGSLCLQIIPRDGIPVIKEIGHLAKTNNWELDELHVETGYLDEVFRRITTESKAVSPKEILT
jgi:ABC-2 type transport system ATP-binding protein